MTNWEDAKRLLTMFQFKHDFLDNHRDYVPAPYLKKLSFFDLDASPADRLVLVVARLKGVEESVVREKLGDLLTWKRHRRTCGHSCESRDYT